LPEGIRIIEGSAFLSCSSLTEVIIPESVTRLGANAFTNCKNIKRVWLTDKITRLEESAFSQCSVDEITFVGNPSAKFGKLVKESGAKTLTLVSTSVIDGGIFQDFPEHLFCDIL
jgi:hypothetical protein